MVVESLLLPVATFLASAVVQGAAGHMAYTAVVHTWGTITKHVKNIDEHAIQNLQQAAHRSFLLALIGICEECLNEPYVNGDDIRWLEQKKVTLQEELEAINDAKYGESSIEDLNKIELLVTSEGELSGDRIQEIKTKLVEAATSGEKPPESYIKNLEKNLFERMGWYFADAIMHNKVVHDIFEEQLLADVHEISKVQQLTAEKVADSLEEILEKLDQMGNEMKLLRTKSTSIRSGLSAHPTTSEAKYLPVENFSYKKNENDMFIRLIMNPLVPDDIFTKSLDTCQFLKAYIPMYFFEGSFEGYFTDETYIDTEKKHIDIPQTTYLASVIGTDLQKFLKLNPSELGSSFWGFFSNKLEKILKKEYSVLHWNVSLNSLWEYLFERCLVKRTYCPFVSFIEDVKQVEYRAIEPKVKDFNEEFTGGFEVLQCSVELGDITSNIERKFNDRIDAVVNNRLKSKKGINIINKTGISRNCFWINGIYIPFWFTIYSYNNKKYMFIKNGSNSKIKDTHPVNKLKLLKVCLYVGALILLFSLIGYVFAYNIYIMLLLVIILVIISIYIYISSINKRREDLKSVLGVDPFGQKNSIFLAIDYLFE